MERLNKITIFATTLQKIKLTELRKYKHTIAVVLLAVYAFIATPVQWWHHHTYAVITTSSLQSAGKAKIATPHSSNKTIEDNCQICGHHYSIYSNDDVSVFKIFISANNPRQGFYALAIPLAPYFNSTNKGPPAVA